MPNAEAKMQNGSCSMRMKIKAELQLLNVNENEGRTATAQCERNKVVLRPVGISSGGLVFLGF